MIEEICLSCGRRMLASKAVIGPTRFRCAQCKSCWELRYQEDGSGVLIQINPISHKPFSSSAVSVDVPHGVTGPINIGDRFYYGPPSRKDLYVVESVVNRPSASLPRLGIQDAYHLAGAGQNQPDRECQEAELRKNFTRADEAV